MDRGRGEFLRQRLARAKERRAGVVGVDDNRFAFARQFVDEKPNAPFILGVGAFEVGHLGAHDHFQFAGPCQRAFDAVSHGGGFAPDRLRERDDLFGGDRFRLDEPDGHFGHGVGDEPHLMRAARHQSGEEEKNERRDQRCERQNRLRRERQPVGVEDFALMEINVQGPAGRPQPHGGEGERHDRAVGLDLQRLPQLADRAAVVVRGRKGGRHRSGLRLDAALLFAVSRGRPSLVPGVRFRSWALGRAGPVVRLIRSACGVRRRADIQRLLDRRQSGGRRVLDLSRCRHSPSPAAQTRVARPISRPTAQRPPLNKD